MFLPGDEQDGLVLLPPEILQRGVAWVWCRQTAWQEFPFLGSESAASPVLLFWVLGECGEGGPSKGREREGEKLFPFMGYEKQLQLLWIFMEGNPGCGEKLGFNEFIYDAAQN